MSHSLRCVSARLSALAVAVGCALAAPAHAGVIMMSTPVFNPATGSHYAYVTAGPGGITWDESFVAAQSLEHMGKDGHLVTITSAAENQFLIDNLTQAVIDMYWLGGFQAPGSPEPAGGWQWVTGETFGYTNWEPVNPEPNDGDGQGEEKLAFWRVNYEDPYIPGQEIGWWNDEPTWFHGLGYIVEFSVPAPTSAGLVAAGLLLAARRRRG